MCQLFLANFTNFSTFKKLISRKEVTMNPPYCRGDDEMLFIVSCVPVIYQSHEILYLCRPCSSVAGGRCDAIYLSRSWHTSIASIRIIYEQSSRTSCVICDYKSSMILEIRAILVSIKANTMMDTRVFVLLICYTVSRSPQPTPTWNMARTPRWNDP